VSAHNLVPEMTRSKLQALQIKDALKSICF